MKILLFSLLFLYADGSIKPPDLPTFSDEPQDTWFKENSTAFLNCSANPLSEMVSYQWMFESNVVSEYNNLTRIQVGKYGAYRCLVSNWFGTITSHTAQVKKPVLRLLSVKDEQKIISEGESLFLPSVEVIESIPPVEKVFWQKKNRPDRWEIVGKNRYTKNGSLFIISASKGAEDNTSYRFIIQQNNGESVIGSHVQVIITGELSNNTCENSSLLFTEVPKSISVYAGEAISIECLAILWKCKFPPNYKWYRNSTISSTLLSREKTLIIAKSNLSDTGNYICLVQTRENKYEAETLVLVTEKPRIQSSTPEVLTVSYKDGSSIILNGSLLTSTDGLQKVHWYANGKLVSRNSKYSITTDNRLIINEPNVSDSGIYQVFYLFDGFELKDAFNAVFLKAETTGLTTPLVPSSLPTPMVLSSNDIFVIATSTNFITQSITLTSLQSSYIVNETFNQSSIVVHPTLVVKKALINDVKFIVSLTIGFLLVTALVVWLIIRNRHQRKTINSNDQSPAPKINYSEINKTKFEILQLPRLNSGNVEPEYANKHVLESEYANGHMLDPQYANEHMLESEYTNELASAENPYYETIVRKTQKP